MAKTTTGSTPQRAASGAKTPDGLTQRQEAFALVFAEIGNASEAYRRAYKPQRMKPKSVNERASQILANVKIQSRLAELRRRVAARVEVTQESLARQLLADREFARQMEQAGAAVAASMGLAKLTGHLVEDRANARRPLSDLSDEELERTAEEARAAIERAREIV